jgi:hypothetical protein
MAFINFTSAGDYSEYRHHEVKEFPASQWWMGMWSPLDGSSMLYWLHGQGLSPGPMGPSLQQ